ncbi:MAG: type III PLP-dependent enzyme [Pseudomonadota bacterium]
MTRSAGPVLALPSALPGAVSGQGLPVFETVSDALAAHKSDGAFAVIYPHMIANMATRFLNDFPGKTTFAVKANPHPAVISTLWPAGVRSFDVASIAEIDLVRSICPNADLYLMHPVKSRRIIRHAYAAGVRDFAFDCAAELRKIIAETDSAKDLSLHLRVALPESAAEMPLTGKFGASFDEAVDLLMAARRFAFRLGIAFHVGSQCHHPSSFSDALTHVRRIVDAAGVELDSLDCGGGFPVDYPGMTPPDLGLFFSEISSGLAANGFDQLDVLGEPGRALCAAGGSTMARVELRKDQTLYINDGTYGTLFDAGAARWRFPVTCHRPGVARPSSQLAPFKLYGPTCDSLDKMDGPFPLPVDIEDGDWIEFGNLGAYGQAMQTEFNGFDVRDTVVVLSSSFA